MITLDTTSIDISDDEIYSVERGSKVYVYVDGKELKRCVYCNVSKGVAICLKRDLSGNEVVVSDGCIVHELVFGVITVEEVDKVEAESLMQLRPTPPKPKHPFK